MTSRKKKQEQPEEVSQIAPELDRFHRQVNEILTSMESINLLAIPEQDDRLSATKVKLDIGLKLPQLLQSLDDLRNRAKLRAEDIKGKKSLSPLEDGTLDDD